jgi:hypothetical protein
MTPDWIRSDIQALVDAHYGMAMPITVRSRDEHSLDTPAWNHTLTQHVERLLWDWNSQTEPCLDLVVWDFTTDSLQLIQSLCFKDAYPTQADWIGALRRLVVTSPSLWVVRHWA